jgi:threonine/homoserine/homoserine lactone efflux protein
MDLSLALKGVLIGLSVAAPIGPMSMLTMRRTIDRGLAAGLVSGLGIALADATYGAIAAFGLTSHPHRRRNRVAFYRLAHSAECAGAG